MRWAVRLEWKTERPGIYRRNWAGRRSAPRWPLIPGWKTECPEMTVDTGLEDGVPWDDRWYQSGRRASWGENRYWTGKRIARMWPPILGWMMDSPEETNDYWARRWITLRWPTITGWKTERHEVTTDTRLEDGTSCGNRRFSADTCQTCSQTVVSLLQIPLLQTLMREFASWRWQAIAICCFSSL
jgi:hypothetical protein